MSPANKKFEYIEQSYCICTSAIKDSENIVEKSFSRGLVRFVKCRKCSTWLQSPVISIQALSDWYDSKEYHSGGKNNNGAYIDYLSEEVSRRKEACARYHKDLAKLLPNKAKVLEVGCSTGSFLAVLKDNGHIVHGVDLSSEFSKQAKDMNQVDVAVSDFLEFGSPNELFNCIVMLGTLSNLHNPKMHLIHAYKMLKPGGFLYANIPFSDSIIARLYGRKYWMFAPSVINFFSKKGLRILLEDVGFKISLFRNDYQQPSLSKLIGHAKFSVLYPLLSKLGIENQSIPWFLPIPGVYKIIAYKNK